jgi:hypothetical protein
MIARHSHAAEAEIFAALAEFVAVEQQLLGSRHVAQLAAVARLLTAGHIGGIIGIGAVGRGNRGVVFLDAALHLGEQPLLQAGRVRQRRLVIGILGFEIGADIGGQQRRVVHHLLPVGGLQPVIIVALSYPCQASTRGRFSAWAAMFRIVIGQAVGEFRAHPLMQ